MTGFDDAFRLMLAAEGGYVNDPRDPGGETNLGITRATLVRAIEDGIVPPGTTIRSLRPDQARAIYHAYYWLKAHCDFLPWPLAAFVFDAAVNQGVDAAVRLLQKAANTVQDGIVGKQTLGAVARADQAELCALFMADRAQRYVGTRNFDRFGRGWFKRLFKLAMGVR